LIKSQIFQPIYMNFPFLDTLGLPNRERARASASTFTDFIVDAVRKECDDSKARKTDQSSQKSRRELSQRLVNACSNGEITEQQFRNNLTITFVAGQENPELALVSTLYLLAKNPVCGDFFF
jgi:unspecific monooxygenase